MVVAKFVVTKNEVSGNASDANDIALNAVYGDSEENKAFFKWTPAYGNNTDADRRTFMKALRDLGSNSYGVFNETDKVEYIGF
jgi:hypothetical protein